MVNPEPLPAAYRRHFDGDEATVLARAPGRVNIIGEHVDYNDGLVLPIAIDRATYAAAGPGRRPGLQIYTAAFDQSVHIDPTDNPPPTDTDWTAYARGVAAGLMDAGVHLGPTQVFVDTQIPLGAGLSSSAAFEVALALALLTLADISLPSRDLARLCRRAEHDYARTPCGIMDPLVCTTAVADHAMLIDCRDESTDPIPWPDKQTVVLIADSQCRRALSDGTYAERVRQCAVASRSIHAGGRPVSSLRDVDLHQLEEARPDLNDTIYRRARHVITEIKRTRDAADALRRGDFPAFGRAMNESHRSLRDDYAVSSPRLDDLAEIIRSAPGVYGAKLTGAGFGGCVVAIAHADARQQVASLIRKRYDAKYGVTVELSETRPCSGAAASVIAHP